MLPARRAAGNIGLSCPEDDPPARPMTSRRKHDRNAKATGKRTQSPLPSREGSAPAQPEELRRVAADPGGVRDRRSASSRPPAILKTLARAIRRPLGSAARRLFDTQYGVDTAGELPVRRLRVVGSHAPRHVDFMSVPPRTFLRAVNAVPAVLDTLTFVDFGCGKGRALLLAAMKPFRRAIGVEHAPELAAIAENNLRCYKGPRLCGDTRVVRADPAKFHLPLDPCLIFFLGPFEDPASLGAVLANVRASLRRRSRPLYAIYIAEIGTEMPERAFLEAGFRVITGPKLSRFDAFILHGPLQFTVFQAQADLEGVTGPHGR